VIKVEQMQNHDLSYLDNHFFLLSKELEYVMLFKEIIWHLKG